MTTVAEVWNTLRDWLQTVRSAEGVQTWVRSAADHLICTGFRLVAAPWTLLVAGDQPVGPQLPKAVGDFTTDDDTSCQTPRVILRAHSDGVRDLVRGYTDRCRLSEGLREDLGPAAWLHDAGKAAPRFQLWLAGSDPVAMEHCGGLLAKSTIRDSGVSCVFRALVRRSDKGWGTFGAAELLSG